MNGAQVLAIARVPARSIPSASHMLALDELPPRNMPSDIAI